MVSAADTVRLLPALGNHCHSWFVTYCKMSFSHTSYFQLGLGGCGTAQSWSTAMWPHLPLLCCSHRGHAIDFSACVFVRQCLSRPYRQSIIAKAVYIRFQRSGLDCWSFELCRFNPASFLLELGKNACLMHHLWKDQLLNSTCIVPLHLLNVLHRFNSLPSLVSNAEFSMNHVAFGVHHFYCTCIFS